MAMAGVGQGGCRGDGHGLGCHGQRSLGRKSSSIPPRQAEEEARPHVGSVRGKQPFLWGPSLGVLFSWEMWPCP